MPVVTARRDAALGSSYRLQYRRPVQFVRGQGMWLYDPDGRDYLDFYNHVPSLGHCHYEVNQAIAEQAGMLSANTRYLEPRLVDYVERLVATFPKELDRVVFTCTGSESNDLALRVARLASGNEGVIVTSYAYQGTSASVAAVSPNLGDAVKLSPNVRMVSLPGPEGLPEAQAADFFEAQIKSAVHDLQRRGIGVSALLMDSIFSSDGVWGDPPGFIDRGVEAARSAGAFYITDEVQPGFGRTGHHMWGFERHDAVVGRRAPMDKFGATARYSNTFAGNTVGIAAADAVLTVLQRDRILDRVLSVSETLRSGIVKMAAENQNIRGVRNAGLFFGIDIGQADMNAVTRRKLVLHMVNVMRDERVLISATGANEDTLKLRPPLICEDDHVGFFLDAFKRVLARVSA